MGLHPIAEFAAAQKPAGQEQGSLVKKSATASEMVSSREPFYVHSESEARALLIRCIGYLANGNGEKLAFDKGYGARDKRAEWIIKEIKERGAITYIRAHALFVFGIPIAVANA
jgi:hypothetical protein